MNLRKLYKFSLPLIRGFYRTFFFVKCEGKENIPKEGSVLICPNHKSNFDPPLVGAFCPREMQFMAKKALFKNKLFGWLIRGLGAIPVEPEENSMETIKIFLRLLKEGNAVTVFPEGTRFSKSIDDVKSGAVMFAIKTKTPIIPTAIKGKYKLFRKMKLTYGKPIYYTEYYGTKVSHEELHRLSVELMTKIYDMAGEEK